MSDQATGVDETKKKKKHRKKPKKKSREFGVFPFLDDKPTVQHMHQCKVLFVMRGLPGSGKTSLVNEITDVYKRAAVCSADNYFLRDGVYCFDPNKRLEAHELCKQEASQHCTNNRRVVVIDNTNVRLWEMKFYQDLAQAHKYFFIPVFPETPWAFDVAKLALLNKHGVSQEMLAKRAHTYETLHPLYWAWVLNEDSSNRLEQLALKYLVLSVQCQPQFAAFCKEQRGDQWCSFHGYYKNISGRPLHCTAFYGGGGTEPGAGHYAANAAVRTSLNSHQTLVTVGFVFTPRTAGVRIALNKQEMLVWNQSDTLPGDGEQRLSQMMSEVTLGGQGHGGGGRGHSCIGEHCSSLSWRDHGQMNRGRGGVVRGCGRGHGVVTEGHSGGCGAFEGQGPSESSPLDRLRRSPRFAPISGPGSRAHVTLGVHGHAQAVQTGFDLLDVVNCEAHSSGVRQMKVDGAIVRYYGEGRCVVYLDKKLTEPAMFMAEY